MTTRNTARPPMATTSIATLNKAVRRLVKGGAEPAQAVVQAARAAGLIAVREYDESGVLYRTQRNRYVFGWTTGTPGFDNQVSDAE